MKLASSAFQMAPASIISSQDSEFFRPEITLKKNVFLPIQWKKKLSLLGNNYKIIVSRINSCSLVDIKLGSVVAWPKSIIFLNVSLYTESQKSPKKALSS